MQQQQQQLSLLLSARLLCPLLDSRFISEAMLQRIITSIRREKVGYYYEHAKGILYGQRLLQEGIEAWLLLLLTRKMNKEGKEVKKENNR